MCVCVSECSESFALVGVISRTVFVDRPGIVALKSESLIANHLGM